jgi:hypothetical protein
MTREEAMGYAAEKKPELKKAIGRKLGEIRALMSAEAGALKAAGGENVLETVLSSVDIFADQLEFALDAWDPGEIAPNAWDLGENAGRAGA